MEMENKVKNRQNVYGILSYFIAIGSFGFIDVWLRVMTRWINAYSIYAIEPNLFTLLWAIFLASLVVIPSGKIGGGNLRNTVFYVPDICGDSVRSLLDFREIFVS